MTMNFGISNSVNQQQKNAYVKQQYSEIYAHEQAHKRAAGSFGGAIVIEKDANGIPTGGHVDILMPALNKDNPDETIKHAETVIKAAMAPGDPSDQDYKVAAEAEHIKAEAENHKKKAGSKLNVVV
jgi:hypothetical protein